MNKVVKAILAIMVAIIYVSLVFVATTTLIPTPKDNQLPTNPGYGGYNPQPTCTRAGADKYCEYQWRSYDRAKLDSAEADNRYKKALDSYSTTTKQTSLHRAELAILLGLVGLVLLYFVRSVTPLVIGFVSSSVTIIVVGVMMLEANAGARQNVIVGALSVFSFLALSVVIWLIDKIMFPKVAQPPVVASSSVVFAPDDHAPTSPVEQLKRDDTRELAKKTDDTVEKNSDSTSNSIPSPRGQSSKKHDDQVIHGVEARHEDSRPQTDEDDTNDESSEV